MRDIEQGQGTNFRRGKADRNGARRSANVPSYPPPSPLPLITVSHVSRSLSLMGPSRSMPFSSSASECHVLSSLIRRLVAVREEEEEEEGAADVADIWDWSWWLCSGSRDESGNPDDERVVMFGVWVGAAVKREIYYSRSGLVSCEVGEFVVSSSVSSRM